MKNTLEKRLWKKKTLKQGSFEKQRFCKSDILTNKDFGIETKEWLRKDFVTRQILTKDRS